MRTHRQTSRLHLLGALRLIRERGDHRKTTVVFTLHRHSFGPTPRTGDADGFVTAFRSVRALPAAARPLPVRSTLPRLRQLEEKEIRNSFLCRTREVQFFGAVYHLYPSSTGETSGAMRGLLLLSVHGALSCILAASGACGLRWNATATGTKQQTPQLLPQSTRDGVAESDRVARHFHTPSLGDFAALPLEFAEESSDRGTETQQGNVAHGREPTSAGIAGSPNSPLPGHPVSEGRGFFRRLADLPRRAAAGLGGLFRGLSRLRFWRRARELPQFAFESDREPGQTVIKDALSRKRTRMPYYWASRSGRASDFVRNFFPREGTVLRSKISGQHVTVRLEEFLWEDVEESVFRASVADRPTALELHIFHIRNTVSAVPLYNHLVRRLEQAAAVPTELRFASAEAMYRSMRCLAPSDLLTLPGRGDLIPSSELRSHANVFSVQPQVIGNLLDFVKGQWVFPDEQSDEVARLSVTVQMVRLLAAYHSKGLVHGRLGPASFVVVSNGTLFLRPRVPPQPDTGRTLEPSFPFAPPEALFENASPTRAADTWSLGLLIYTVWCHQKLPFGLGYREFDSEEYAARHKPFDVFSIPVQPKPWRDPFCNPTSPVSDFIDKLLQFSPSRRLLPQAALSDSHFVGIQRELERALPQPPPGP